jgi:hypothetical protein
MSSNSITQMAIDIRRSIDAPAGGTAERQIRAALRAVALRCIQIAEERESKCRYDQAAASARLIAKTIRTEFNLTERGDGREGMPLRAELGLR